LEGPVHPQGGGEKKKNTPHRGENFSPKKNHPDFLEKKKNEKIFKPVGKRVHREGNRRPSYQKEKRDFGKGKRRRNPSPTRQLLTKTLNEKRLQPPGPKNPTR